MQRKLWLVVRQIIHPGESLHQLVSIDDDLLFLRNAIYGPIAIVLTPRCFESPRQR